MQCIGQINGLVSDPFFTAQRNSAGVPLSTRTGHRTPGGSNSAIRLNSGIPKGNIMDKILLYTDDALLYLHATDQSLVSFYTLDLSVWVILKLH